MQVITPSHIPTPLPGVDPDAAMRSVLTTGGYKLIDAGS